MLGILTGTITEQDVLTILHWRHNKTIYTAYTGLARHNHPFSTFPPPHWWGRPGSSARRVGKWTVDVVVSTFTVAAAVSKFAPAKRPPALPIVQCMTKRRDQVGIMGGGSYEIELMPQKEMTEVAGLKPGLET